MKILSLKGEIEVLTGLHIGAGDDTMKIGGIDNPVIKDPNTNEPYIPGSSLKGKMRSLLEWHLGLVGISNGEPFSGELLDNQIFNENEEENKEKKVQAQTLLKVFGDKSGKSGITRASFGDCRLTEDSKELETSEAKYENMIDRKKGTAKNPRQTERVPAGVKFAYDIRIKVLDDDNEKEFKALIQKGLNLIENDYLGGNGSRGYGRVRFSNKDDWEKI